MAYLEKWSVMNKMFLYLPLDSSSWTPCKAWRWNFAGSTNWNTLSPTSDLFLYMTRFLKLNFFLSRNNCLATLDLVLLFKLPWRWPIKTPRSGSSFLTSYKFRRWHSRHVTRWNPWKNGMVNTKCLCSLNGVHITNWKRWYSWEWKLWLDHQEFDQAT